MRRFRFSTVATVAIGTIAFAACSDEQLPVTAVPDAAGPDARASTDATTTDATISDASSMGETIGEGGDAKLLDVASTLDSSADAGVDAAAFDGSDGGTDTALPDAPTTRSVTLRFKAKVGNADFACGTTYPDQGSTAVRAEARDFRMYVSNIFLVDNTGNKVPVTLETRSPWQIPGVALLDFEDGTGACAAEGTPEMNDTITGTVPAGDYRGIVFSNLVPDSISHGDPLTAPAPLQLGAMTWGWLYGFKFVKAELAAVDPPTGDAAPGLGLLHLGSTGCTNATDGGEDFNAPPSVACTTLNRNEIHLTGFDPATSVIIADIGALFIDTDLSQDNQCHSEGPACPSLFSALGLRYANGAVLPSQTAYRVQ